MNVNDVYSLSTGKFIDSLVAVDNPFIRQLAKLSADSAKSLKILSYVMKDKSQNRGEIQQRGIRAADKSVVDIAKLTPLVGAYGSRTLLEEVASYRADSLGFLQEDVNFAKDNKEMLMVDYLLSACLCYVEVFDGSKVEKYFATRNRFLAGGISGLKPEETVKYTNYLQAFPSNYSMKQLKVLKLNLLKSGFKVVQPRSFLDFNKSVKVVPLFFLSLFVEGISDILNQGIVRFKYIKDNMTEREFITTLNPEILLRHYDQEFVHTMMANIETVINRGYIRLPELGISKYDATGVRALNISRITSLEVITEFDTRFIEVDFDIILPFFKDTIDNLKHPDLLRMVHEDLTGQPPQTAVLEEIKHSIKNFVDGQYAIGTTTALRYLHIYMVQRPQIFAGYNEGRRREYSGFGSTGFNLGGSTD